MFMQNFIELSAAVHELSGAQQKNSDKHNTAIATARTVIKQVQAVAL